MSRPTVTIRVDATDEEIVIDATQEVPEKWTPYTVVDGNSVASPDIAPEEDVDTWDDDGGRVATSEEEAEIDELLAEQDEESTEE